MQNEKTGYLIVELSEVLGVDAIVADGVSSHSAVEQLHVHHRRFRVRSRDMRPAG